MKRPTSFGECALCGKRSSKAGISRHLRQCLMNQPQNGKSVRLFHLRIEGRYRSQYWLDLEIPAAARLADLSQLPRLAEARDLAG